MEWRDTDHVDLGGHWIGWRVRGRVLISPDKDRITPERLRGLLFRESLRLWREKEARRRKAKAFPGEDFSQGLRDRVADLRPRASDPDAGKA